MLFWRATASHPLARLALVDGSTVRVAGRRRAFQLALPRIVPTFVVDYEDGDQGRTRDQEPGTKDQKTCAASPVS